ncbi:MAG: GNAT family N-acetyltransferase [Thermomicrobiales bacterium]
MTQADESLTTDRWTTGDDPDQTGHRFLEARIDEFNKAVTGVHQVESVAYFVRDESNAIVAGLSSWIWDNCLHVEFLWVREDRRGCGYGTRLMELAERAGRERGCREMMLDTHSFQAPDFYRRLGFAVCAVIEDYPLGHQKFTLRKVLT